MKRRQRTEILINGSRTLPKQLATSIEKNYKITILSQPQEALIMVKMRETAKRSLFYLGEVLVTETKVEIGQHIGTGLIVGHDEELSYWLAIIDAAFLADLPEVQGWESLLLEEEEILLEERKRKHASILKTKVNFETMDI